ncbi:MAG: DUF1194 domain-containing protein [Pseudomonadota bacterium]
MTNHGIAPWRGFVLLLAALTFCAVTSNAETGMKPRYASNDTTHPGRVDIALVLAVDVSSSIEASERRFQREAYAEALRDPRVAQMALGGRTGRVAIAYMEWSGKRYQRVLLPMRVMSSASEMAGFAGEILAIEDAPNDPMFVQPTAVGDALLAAETAMAELDVPARDYIIDISGDGVLNDGRAILAARQHVLSLGLTVNGLPIEVASNSSATRANGIERVARFYMDCVIGGPGAFHLVARGFGDVRETLIMKLMLEMADIAPEQKSRIAAAWNGGALGDQARVIPAVVLDLSPSEKKPRNETDCGPSPGGSTLIP